MAKKSRSLGKHSSNSSNYFEFVLSSSRRKAWVYPFAHSVFVYSGINREHRIGADAQRSIKRGIRRVSLTMVSRSLELTILDLTSRISFQNKFLKIEKHKVLEKGEGYRSYSAELLYRRNYFSGRFSFDLLYHSLAIALKVNAQNRRTTL